MTASGACLGGAAAALWLLLATQGRAEDASRIVGACRFDLDQLAFAGTPQDQAACLLRHVGKGGRLDPTPRRLPPVLAQIVGQSFDLSLTRLERRLRGEGLAALAERLGAPVSRGRGGASDAPFARYFVIHDTSEPMMGTGPLPADPDHDPRVNDLGRYWTAAPVAHLFLSRTGAILIGHDLGEPWRATKLESWVIGVPAKGLFLHVENVLPRRADPSGPPGNDFIAPDEGFSPVQYDRLALMYVYASARRGAWLIPAFHAAVDEGIPDAHDDPQNFNFERFTAALTALRGALAKP